MNAEKVAAGMMELCQAPSWASGSVGLVGNAAQIIPAASRMKEAIGPGGDISNVAVADVLAVAGGLSDMAGNAALQRKLVMPAAILKGTGLLAGVAQNILSVPGVGDVTLGQAGVQLTQQMQDSWDAQASGTDRLFQALAEVGQGTGQAELDFQQAVQDGLSQLFEAADHAIQAAGQAEQESWEAQANGVDKIFGGIADILQAGGQAELDFQEAVYAGMPQLLDGLNTVLDAAGQSEQASAEAMADGVDQLLAAAKDLILAAGQDDQETAEAMAAGVGQLFSSLDDFLQSAGGSLASILLSLANSNSAMAAMLATIKNLFHTAEITRSPLVLDLDGDGVETLGTNASIHFDHDGNRFAELTGWAGADDGLLVWDRNGNGSIDNGSELFGNNTLLANGQKAANGFAALAELDTNLDGRIDSQDAAFSQLRVWKDGDSNAQVANGELLSLETAGILSLATGFTAQTVTDAQGNRHLQAGQYTGTDGSTRAMDDVWFANDTARTIDLDLVAVDPAIAALPDLPGFGNVHSLHQAMARDDSGTLRSLVEAFVAETDSAARTAIVTQLIYVWAGVDGIDPNSRAASMIYGNIIGDARKLAALEALLGESYIGVWCWGTPDPNPHGQAAPLLLNAFNTLVDYVSTQLSWQTTLDPVYNSIGLSWDAATQAFDFDISETLSLLHGAYNENTGAGQILLNDFAASLKNYGDHGEHILSLLRAQGDCNGDDFAAALYTMGYQTLLGGAGNDALAGSTGDDLLLGQSGDDSLSGNTGNDILIGGTGNDTLYGGTGDDTFRFNLGDGQDVIVNDEVAGVNTLAFGAGITQASLKLVRSGDHLVVKVGDQGDQVTLQGWYATDSKRNNWTGYRLDTISFADGTSMAASALLLQKPVSGTDGNDILNGYYGASLAENDWFEGGLGDDTLFGDTGNDTLDGGAGTDILKGGEGNDILIGGIGNDTLYGGNGDDTFRFNLGDGQDVIVNDEVAGVNTLAFGAGITQASLKLVRSGDHLVVKVGDQGDQVTLQGWYATDSNRNNWAGYRLDTISFADGTSMAASALLLQKPVSGTDGNDILNGYYGSSGGYYGASLTENDWFEGGLGDDTLFGDTGNDTLDGGAGTDILKGGEGNDILIGGIGNDTLYGGNGSDVFVFDTALVATSNQDSLMDFIAGQDKIQLCKDVFPALSDDSTLTSDYFCSSANGMAIDSNDYILYNTASGALLYDADGNGAGAAVQFATLTTKPAITASDCMVVA